MRERKILHFYPIHKLRQVLALRISYTRIIRTGMSRIVVSSSFLMWNYQNKKIFFIGFIRFYLASYSQIFIQH
jgi:hypothetical protein